MSLKNTDKKNRFRSKTVSFRVSPEEWEQIETAVKLSGHTKQDYIIKKLENRDVVVQGNPRVYTALKNQLAIVLEELQQKEIVSEELLETINLITITLNRMKGEMNE